MGTMFDYRTIVVGTDGSPLAAPTVSRAAWLAAHNDADLVIVCAYSGLTRREEARNVASLGDSRIGQVPGRAAASEAIADAVAVAQELLATAEERGADLIVVGALRDTSIADRLLGTVATEVVRRAECEVLVVRPRNEAAELPPPQDPVST